MSDLPQRPQQPARAVSRRPVLLAGVGVLGTAGIGAGVWRGRRELAAPEITAAPVGDPATPLTLTDGSSGAAVVRRDATLRSRKRGRTVRWIAATPGAGAAGLPVVLVLHGRGADARAAFDPAGLDLGRALSAHVRAGLPPLALVSVDGGSAYWHPRVDGDDPLGMLVDELLPSVADLGLDPGRLGALGWSMGGYGALLLARESARGGLRGYRLGAAAAMSPALFAAAVATSPGSFDGPGDYARWGDLVADPDIGRVPLHVLCGRDDPFAEQTRRFLARARPAPSGGITPGGHDNGYWRSHAPEQLAFLAWHLAG